MIPCVYFHCRPDGAPFYVGKGSAKRATHFHGRNKYHQNIVAKYGKENILVEVTPCADEEEAYFLEQLFILLLRERGVELANMSDGGEGGNTGLPRSQQTRRKISMSLRGHPVSVESKSKNSNSHIGRRHPPRSQEARMNISRSLRGRSFSTAHRQNISLALAGKKRKPLSEETKKKISAAHRARFGK